MYYATTVIRALAAILFAACATTGMTACGAEDPTMNGQDELGDTSAVSSAAEDAEGAIGTAQDAVIIGPCQNSSQCGADGYCKNGACTAYPSCQQDPCQTARLNCSCVTRSCTFVTWGQSCLAGDTPGQYKITHHVTGKVDPTHCLYWAPGGVQCPIGGKDVPTIECVTPIP
jgi:hypothetical protein